MNTGNGEYTIIHTEWADNGTAQGQMNTGNGEQTIIHIKVS